MRQYRPGHVISLVCTCCGISFTRVSWDVRGKYHHFCSTPCRLAVAHRSYHIPFEERFWACVNRETCLGDVCGCHRGIGHCWPWMATRSKRGYGRAWADGKLVQAHRVASTLTVPLMRHSDLHALHHCDNPICCRPDHVFHGTHAQNMQDAAQKGRCHGRRPSKITLGKRPRPLSINASLEEIREYRRALAARKSK